MGSGVEQEAATQALVHNSNGFLNGLKEIGKLELVWIRFSQFSHRISTDSGYRPELDTAMRGMILFGDRYHNRGGLAAAVGSEATGMPVQVRMPQGEETQFETAHLLGIIDVTRGLSRRPVIRGVARTGREEGNLHFMVVDIIPGIGNDPVSVRVNETFWNHPSRRFPEEFRLQTELVETVFPPKPYLPLPPRGPRRRHR